MCKAFDKETFEIHFAHDLKCTGTTCTVSMMFPLHKRCFIDITVSSFHFHVNKYWFYSFLYNVR